MLLALVFATVSVALGLALGLSGREGSLGPVRAFAIGASLATVFGALLPEALSEASPWALLVFAAGVAGPSLFERVGRALGQGAGSAGLEVGFVGLSLHQLADGLAAGAMNEEGTDHARLDLLLSMAGHTVPVVAAVVIAFAAHRGRPSAVVRAFGLAVAATLGIALASSPAAAAWVHDKMPLIASAAAGLLLHVVLHGSGTHPPRSLAARLTELAALMGGVWGISLLAGPGHEHGQENLLSGMPPHAVFVGSFEKLLMAATPGLVVGLAVAVAWPSQASSEHAHSDDERTSSHQHGPSGPLDRLDTLVLRAVPWVLVGVAVAAAIETTLTSGIFAGLGRSWIDVWITLVIVVPLLSIVGRERSMRLGLALASVSLAVVITGQVVGVAGAAARPVAFVSGAVLVLLLLRVSLTHGVRHLFASLMPGHEHEHDDGHDHAH